MCTAAAFYANRSSRIEHLCNMKNSSVVCFKNKVFADSIIYSNKNKHQLAKNLKNLKVTTKRKD